MRILFCGKNCYTGFVLKTHLYLHEKEAPIIKGGTATRKESPKVTIALVAVNVIIFLLAEIISGSTLSTPVLVKWGGADVERIALGEYWRLFTAMFLHAGIRHLLNNMLILYVLGQHLEYLLGPVKYALLYLACGVIANLTAFRFYLMREHYVVAVGASGAVFAVIGALIWIILLNKGHVRGLTLRQMMIMLAFSLYFGLVSTDVSNAAHIAGLIAGFISGIVLYRKR